MFSVFCFYVFGLFWCLFDWHCNQVEHKLWGKVCVLCPGHIIAIEWITAEWNGEVTSPGAYSVDLCSWSHIRSMSLRILLRQFLWVPRTWSLPSWLPLLVCCTEDMWIFYRLLLNPGAYDWNASLNAFWSWAARNEEPCMPQECVALCSLESAFFASGPDG